MTRQIKPVENNQEKYETYRALKGRYAKAMHYGFYFEAMLIDYALLEDRLRSFLYHAGALANRESFKINAQRTKTVIKDILRKYKRDGENDSIGIVNISGKIKVVRSILRWSSETAEVYEERYPKALKNQCESLDAQALLETLDHIREWCDYRNEVIHAALNKNIESLYSDLEEKAVEGKQYADYIDSQIRILKKGNKVRKAANLVVEK
ncbi:MAG: hypothetical protein MR991_00175 [Clostridiales bacterium]|nr:hypothetical protein [Clostridiales bacterium]MCI7619073.1 hypothetical protein [Bacillota bacterium]MDD7035805.1 hypothetical protein [Bacillota bacterium]MDY2920169.1 hypothetical protein [Lentihominibacter sp.]